MEVGQRGSPRYTDQSGPATDDARAANIAISCQDPSLKTVLRGAWGNTRVAGRRGREMSLNHARPKIMLQPNASRPTAAVRISVWGGSPGQDLRQAWWGSETKRRRRDLQAVHPRHYKPTPRDNGYGEYPMPLCPTFPKFEEGWSHLDGSSAPREHGIESSHSARPDPRSSARLSPMFPTVR